jgi:hypothetical protein
MYTKNFVYDGINFVIEYELFDGEPEYDDQPEIPGYVDLHSIKYEGNEFLDLLDKSVIYAIENRLYWQEQNSW